MKCIRRWMSHRIDTPAQKEYIPVMKIKNHLLDDPKVDTSLQSPNVSSGTIKPTIIVLHYTASGGEDGKGDASYLSRATSRASAHVVAGRNGSLDQIVPFNKRAWHAGKSSYNGRDDVNDFSIGIEIDNWGWLSDSGKSHSGTLVPANEQFAGTRSGHNKWEAYKPEQLEAVDEVIRAICIKYDITDIVGHEDIAPGRKQDPGPALDAFIAKMKEKHLGKAPVKPAPKTEAPTQKGTKKVTTDGLRLRARPNLHATILTHLNKNYEVKVLQSNVFPGWDKIQYKQKVGYVANRYLTS
jgi:N-acetylmuramoyl-L-alanine amidase